MSGQNWKIVNLDKRQSQGGTGGMRQFLFQSTDAAELLINLTVASVGKLFVDPVRMPLQSSRNYSSARNSKLMALPTELIGHIFACTHAELIDAIRLGLTCQRMWAIARYHLSRCLPSLRAARSWAGDRIICVGGAIRPANLPWRVFSEQEIFDFFRPPPTTLFSYPYSTPPRESTFSAMLVAAVEGKLAPRDRYLFESLVRVNASWADERPPQVLRNLSRRVYVTESKVRWAYPTGATGLGELLLSRICRSSVGSADVPHPGLHRGVWAGDRFDIVSEVQWMSQLMKLAGNADPWLDVSEEVLTEYDAISACRRR